MQCMGDHKYTCPECEYDELIKDYSWCPMCGEKINWRAAWYRADTEGEG
jgi:predicted RNA-binding Zn-ribbon protein involved in translation (DUF1610 family)